MRSRRIPWVLWAAMAAVVSCQRTHPPTDAPAKDSAAPPVAAGRPKILLIGTSITAGYGLDPADSWAAHLQEKIDSAGLHFEVVNAGVSGESSSDALHRMDWVLGTGAPAMIVVETGANDGLRGQPTDSMRANLDAILARLDTLVPRPVIVVAGMEALPNLGRAYREEFRSVFPAAAKAHHDVYLPFLLDHVAGVDTLNQGDGIHPNRSGSRIVAQNVWQVLGPILDSIARSRR
jgi:acyl-CoA thioesterase-1